MVITMIGGQRSTEEMPLNGGTVLAGTFLIAFAGLLGWDARKIWLDPGYARRTIERGPAGRAYSRKTWRGGVRGSVPMAIAPGLMGVAVFALGSAEKARPGHPGAGVFVAGACLLLVLICFGCHLMIVWFNRPRWLVPPHMREDAGNAVAQRRRSQTQDRYTPERAAQLIAILTDPHARGDERDDVAMDLEFFSGPEVESALAETIRNEDFSSVLAQTAAESLAGIWAREGRIDQDFFDELKGQAKYEVLGILSARAPHLLPC